MSILLMMKEGGSLGIDTIGNLPIDEDLDFTDDVEYSAIIGLASFGFSTLGKTVNTEKIA
jgi:hypothetical protein|tara:strand:- start:468 stop:647 length:180 start_codon:yes stop_codon:yes gene_type:complete